MNPFAAIAQPVAPFRAFEPQPDPALVERARRKAVVPEAPPNPRNLTNVQWAVIGLTVQGYAAKEVGAHLGISCKTVDCHIYELKRRMGARNIVHAAVMWDRHQGGRG